mgnify:CR=1 FL=1
MKYKIYHNARCRKSREALQLLETMNEEVEIVEYLKDPLSTEDFNKLLMKLNMRPEELIRKNESLYKQEYRGLKLTDEEWVDTMLAHPKLIERPIVELNHRAVVARPAERIEELKK